MKEPLVISVGVGKNYISPNVYLPVFTEFDSVTWNVRGHVVHLIYCSHVNQKKLARLVHSLISAGTRQVVLLLRGKL